MACYRLPRTQILMVESQVYLVMLACSRATPQSALPTSSVNHQSLWVWSHSCFWSVYMSVGISLSVYFLYNIFMLASSASLARLSITTYIACSFSLPYVPLPYILNLCLSLLCPGSVVVKYTLFRLSILHSSQKFGRDPYPSFLYLLPLDDSKSPHCSEFPCPMLLTNASSISSLALTRTKWWSEATSAARWNQASCNDCLNFWPT